MVLKTKTRGVKRCIIRNRRSFYNELIASTNIYAIEYVN